MKTLAERLNFSVTETNDTSIKIDNRKDINFYETLCLYCSDKNINLNNVSDDDFDGAVMTMQNFSLTERGEYSFWIDVE